MTDLTGEIALVTGASSGLGHRFAKLLARRGATVVAAARRTDRLDDLVGEITEDGGRATALAFDATDPAAPARLIDEASEEIGFPTLLINNAGVNRPGRAHEGSDADFDETMAVNLRAPWRLSQICAKHWIAQQSGGVIVNIASILSERVGAGMSLYAMSKAALRHMTAAHALEWARHGIRVNALCPGYVRTEINDSFWETPLGQEQLARMPRRRVGDPSDLDSALLFLVDPASGFVNGTALTVDDAQSWGL